MSSRLKSGSLAALIVLVSGCSLFDPYVKAPGPKSQSDCKDKDFESANGPEPTKAFLYARCVRDDMDARAGRFAVLNSGGSTFLLSLAGLTTYRSFRGSSEANIQALATGGATLYAAQKYLYRNPRETIYAAGSATIDCGIAITRRRVAADDQTTVDALSTASETLNSVTSYRKTAANLAALPEPNASCPVTTRQKWEQAKDRLSSEDDSAMQDVGRRISTARARLELYIGATEYAQIDLISLTSRVRGTVNRQLALEQPDPLEIASAISILQLPSPELPEGGPSPPQAAPKPTDPSRTKGTSRGQTCNVDETRAEQFEEAVNRFIDSMREARRHAAALEARLNVIESSGMATSTEQLLKACALQTPSTATPFNIRPGTNPLRASAGETVLVPIEGGVSPYVANVAVPPQNGQITITQKLLESGTYALSINVTAGVPLGTYLIVSNDQVGAFRSFQIEVRPK